MTEDARIHGRRSSIHLYVAHAQCGNKALLRAVRKVADQSAFLAFLTLFKRTGATFERAASHLSSSSSEPRWCVLTTTSRALKASRRTLTHFSGCAAPHMNTSRAA